MMNALDWLNEQGGEQIAELGDPTALLAHVEKYHPITDEFAAFVESNLPKVSLELELVRLISNDEIIEVSESYDETGFLLSLGYVPIGEFEDGIILFNVNDSSVHMLVTDSLDLSRVELDEDSGEYFWDGEPLEEGSDEFEMVFEECCTQFNSFNEFDIILTGVLKGETAREELGI